MFLSTFSGHVVVLRASTPYATVSAPRSDPTGKERLGGSKLETRAQNQAIKQASKQASKQDREEGKQERVQGGTQEGRQEGKQECR